MLLLDLPAAVQARVCLYLGARSQDTARFLGLARGQQDELRARGCTLCRALRQAILGDPRRTGRLGPPPPPPPPPPSEPAAPTNTKNKKKTKKRTASPQVVHPSKRRRSRRLEIVGKALLVDAAALLDKNSQYAHDEICGIAPGQTQKPKLSLASLRKTLKKWAPLDADCVHPRGSTLLSECVRMRRASCRQALACAREMLVKWGCDPNIGHPGSGLLPIHIASARGMPKVVELLLAHGAAAGPGVRGKGTFTSSITTSTSNSRIRLTGTFSALEWCVQMERLELQAGVGRAGVANLRRCRRILERAQLAMFEAAVDAEDEQ